MNAGVSGLSGWNQTTLGGAQNRHIHKLVDETIWGQQFLEAPSVFCLAEVRGGSIAPAPPASMRRAAEASARRHVETGGGGQYPGRVPQAFARRLSPAQTGRRDVPPSHVKLFSSCPKTTDLFRVRPNFWEPQFLVGVPKGELWISGSCGRLTFPFWGTSKSCDRFYANHQEQKCNL